MVVTENEVPVQPLGEVLKQMVRVVLGAKLLPVKVTVDPTGPRLGERVSAGGTTENEAEASTEPSFTSTEYPPEVVSGTVSVADITPLPSEDTEDERKPKQPTEEVLKHMVKVVLAA